MIADADPEDFQLQNRVGQLLFRQGRYPEASECFRVALAADTSNTSLLYSLGEPSHCIAHRLNAVSTLTRWIVPRRCIGVLWRIQGL